MRSPQAVPRSLGAVSLLQLRLLPPSPLPRADRAGRQGRRECLLHRRQVQRLRPRCPLEEAQGGVQETRQTVHRRQDRGGREQG